MKSHRYMLFFVFNIKMDQSLKWNIILEQLRNVLYVNLCLFKLQWLLITLEMCELVMAIAGIRWLASIFNYWLLHIIKFEYNLV